VNDHPAIIGVVLATGCLVPAVGWVGCGILGGAALLNSGIKNFRDADSSGHFHGWDFAGYELWDVAAAAGVFFLGGGAVGEAAGVETGSAGDWFLRGNGVGGNDGLSIPALIGEIKDWNKV
jgi:hypothetical protein